MYRIIFLVPKDLEFNQLTTEQQAAVQSVLGQHVSPMPFTKVANNKKVVDGVAADNFDPATLGPLGLPFEIIGLYKDDGTPVIPINSSVFIQYLPDKVTYDTNGAVVSTSPPVLHEPHRWAGMPEMF